MSKYLIVDGDSLGHAANSTPKLSIGELPVQAIFGFLRMLRQQMAFFPGYTPIVCWDGASWRKQIFSEYKANRDRKETKWEVKQAKAKDAYSTQVPYIKKALRMLGIAQLWSVNMEADDLAAILVDRYTSKGGTCVLISGDKDWIQLVGPNVKWRDIVNKREVTTKNFEEFTGVKTPKQFVEIKALAGDQGDNISGVGGIGEKGAVEFLKTYGSFRQFMNMATLEMTPAQFKKLPKKHRDLVDDETKAITFAHNIDLMDLRTSARPAPQDLRLDKGEASKEKFQRFCELLVFKSILQELDDWLSVFPAFPAYLETV